MILNYFISRYSLPQHLYCVGNLQCSLKFYPHFIPSSYRSWLFLHLIHLHSDLFYWPCHDLFYNHVMLSSNLLLYRPQPWFFQRLPHGLSHPFYMWLLLRFSESKPMRDPVMEVPRAQRRCGDTEYVSNPKRSSYLITDLKPKPICICILYLP